MSPHCQPTPTYELKSLADKSTLPLSCSNQKDDDGVCLKSKEKLNPETLLEIASPSKGGSLGKVVQHDG